MIRLPASPRARRRLLRVAAGLAVLALGLGLVLLMPGTKPSNPEPSGNEGPAQLAAATPTAHLSAADRRAIDETLDRFVPAGMERRDPARAWALAGPEMKSGSTLADWRAGSSPIPYYLPTETTFHDWQTIDVGPRYVIFNLLLHPRNRSVGSYVFSGQVVKRGGRWLVNRLYTIAIMKPPTRSGLHEVGPADFAAPGGSAQSPPGKPLLGRIGIIPVVSILALIFLIPLGLGAVALLRARRWRRIVRANGRTALPPLPSRSFGATEEGREPARKP